jgi:RNA polymerase sigma-70 factor, ECF subfamily
MATIPMSQDPLAEPHQLPQPANPFTAHESNLEIAAKLRAHDPAVISELFSRYEVKLRRYLWRLTANREMAEDLLQETWMRVVVRGAQFKGDSQFATWLFAIARNLVYDRNRRWIPTTSLDELNEHGDYWQRALPGHPTDQHDRVAAAEQCKLLSHALQSLSPEQRTVIHLRFYQEMSFAEISRRMNAPLPTIKARFYRSLAHLQRMLQAAQTPGNREWPLAG